MEQLHDSALHIEIETLVGIITAIGVPALLWSWRVFAMVKDILHMHMAPDDHGFGTSSTNALILKQTEMMSKIHIERDVVLLNLTLAIQELSHFMQWISKEQLGGTSPPPFVRQSKSKDGGIL